MLTENAKKMGLLKAGTGVGGGFKPKQRRFKMKAMMNCHDRIAKLEEVLDRLEARRDMQLERIQELQAKKEMKRKEEVQVKLQERIEQIQQRSEIVKERIGNVEQRLANKLWRFHCLQDQLMSSRSSSSNEETFQEQETTQNISGGEGGEDEVSVDGDLATTFGTVVDISERNSFKDMKHQVKMARKSMNQDGIKKHDLVSVQITPGRIVRDTAFRGGVADFGGAATVVPPGTSTVVVMTKKQLLMRMRNQMKQIRKARRQAVRMEKRQVKMARRELKIN